MGRQFIPTQVGAHAVDCSDIGDYDYKYHNDPLMMVMMKTNIMMTYM